MGHYFLGNPRILSLIIFGNVKSYYRTWKCNTIIQLNLKLET
jgi:hypothetical protein